ncbi:transglycosylase SLT domain-containing protein [Sulfitobacter sp. S190]|uniref:transglycosylase SLT domain-containing protein n=1 Tax=Sulfitobacter sp. S190 TaxID=2867022 RepID=UPI0021A76A04|nr:transglycosylase SLT domain-containing protein [Sulfitobacter sp. S190]UWR22363.1 transglycosylase SLT domain-containing protein [Sulfitobacter sp. S190]
MGLSVANIFRIFCFLSFVLLGTTQQPKPAPASGDDWLICDLAAQRVAAETTVPLDVLRTITRTETGRTRNSELQPWPWTVNMEGKGTWHSNRAEATAYAKMHLDRGARSFDVGCFQINYRWHGNAFRSIEEMFDPEENTRYAAAFLQDLYREFGNWTAAAGAYHSRTKQFADKYISRFSQIRENLDAPALPPVIAARTNTYPFFQAAPRNSSLGSLVPLGASGRSLFAPQNEG